MLSIVACFVGVITGMLLVPVDRVFVDWITYANAVDRFVSGQSLFAPQQLSGQYFLPDVVRAGYAYPPPSILLFLPFASYPVGLVGWTVLNVGLLVTGLLAVVRKEMGRVTPLLGAAMLGSLALYVPFTEGVAVGNVNVGLAGVFAWAWVIGRSSPGMGVLAGVGAVVKIVPGALVFWSDRRTFVRTAAISLAVATFVSVVTLPLMGIHAWTDFMTALGNSQPNCSGPGLHASLACVIEPLTGPVAARSMVVAIALAAGIGAVLTRTPTVAFALVVVASVFPATDGHSHSLLVLYVLLVILSAHLVGVRSRRPGAASVSGVSAARSTDASAAGIAEESLIAVTHLGTAGHRSDPDDGDDRRQHRQGIEPLRR